ncbi:MAG TPA: alpha/beta hydrolase [Labilithrix sp.]|nr:alpha/beta hydrolase [Labilithrix sp.]
MQTFDYKGLPIKYVRQGRGEPIVFIHNGGTSHTIWRDVLPRFSDRYEVFALDLLGFGDSAKPDTGYTLENYVGLLSAFIDAHELAPLRLVGNCMGSAMSLAFAMQRPQDVRALVLVNPLTDATFSAGWLGSTLWLRKNAPGVSRGIAASIGRLRLPNAIGEQSLAFQFGSIGRKRKLHLTPELCACFTAEGQTHSLLAVFDDIVTYATLDTFEPGPTFPPICTIWGLENRVLSAKAGRKLNATLRPAREEWLEGCGHLPMLEKPDEISAIIDEFFGERRAAVA